MKSALWKTHVVVSVTIRSQYHLVVYSTFFHIDFSFNKITYCTVVLLLVVYMSILALYNFYICVIVDIHKFRQMDQGI